MAIVIQPDGTQVELKPERSNGTLTLEQMQKAVGGYIEIVPANVDEVVVCNEEGKLYDPPLPLNVPATIRSGWLHDPLRGNIIFCTRREMGDEEEDGDAT